MSSRTKRVRHRPLVLLAAAGAAAAMLWVIGTPTRAMAATSSGFTIGNCTLPQLTIGNKQRAARGHARQLHAARTVLRWGESGAAR
jgi:hypothetical protein